MPFPLRRFSLWLAILVACGCSGPTSDLNDRGVAKPEYQEAVDAASADGVVITCDAEGEVTFLDFHAHPNVSDAVKHVKPFPNLQMLNFSSSALTDADLENLADKTQLEELGLHGTQVTDEGLDHLSELSKLRTLNLTDTTVGDGGLAKLSGLTSLVRIDLQNTKVTDEGLKHLETLKDLMYIELSNSGVSDEGADKLRAQFPDAQVVKNVIVDTSGVPMKTDAELPDF